jgi:hypothetical protein
VCRIIVSFCRDRAPRAWDAVSNSTKPASSLPFPWRRACVLILLGLRYPISHHAGPSSCPYSPECMEWKFSEVELRVSRILGSLALPLCYRAHTAMEHIHSLHARVCCLRCVASRCRVKAQGSYLSEEVESMDTPTKPTTKPRTTAAPLSTRLGLAYEGFLELPVAVVLLVMWVASTALFGACALLMYAGIAALWWGW